VLGILLVVTVILSAYIMGEGFSGGRQNDGPIGQVVRESGELMDKAGGWLAQHSSSILGEGSGVLLMLCAAAGGVLLLIDRWLSSRMGHR
jgi:hypothetical protein